MEETLESRRSSRLVRPWDRMHRRDVQVSPTVHLREGGIRQGRGRVFNSGFDGNAVRALVLHEGDTVDETAFKRLVRAAVAANAAETVPRVRNRP